MTVFPAPHRLLAVLAAGVLAIAPCAARDDPASRAASPEDAIRAASVASPYRIPEQAGKGEIRYRIAMHGGAAWPWPETGEQHVEHDGDTVVLTICATCGREPRPTAEELQRDLRPNHWVDNADAHIRMFASDARGAGIEHRMRELVHLVQQQLNGSIDFGDYLTAREAYDARQGDCTEYALLLAAAAKSRHIPVRVVAGLAYASRFLGMKRVFSPHMWVQAWDGRRWTSYDAGLGDFDATHIALVVGDGSPESIGNALARLSDVRIVDAQGIVPVAATAAATTP